MSMRIPNNALQAAIYTALNGSITLSGSAVPIYDKVPNRPWDDSKTFDVWVRIAEPVLTPFQGTKDRFINNLVVNLEIISLYEGQSNAGGQKAVVTVADQITNILIDRGGSNLSIAGFTIIGQTLSDFQTAEGEQSGLYFTGANLRINYLIEQNA